MKDVVDFRVDERFAVGHDALNTIVFRKISDAVNIKSNHPRFDGAVWKGVAFIYLDKRVLLRVLREMGVHAAETCGRPGGRRTRLAPPQTDGSKP